MLGQLADQELFGWGGRFVFELEALQDVIERLSIFPIEQGEDGTGEAVREVIARDGRLAFGRFGTGGTLCIGAVSVELCCGGHGCFSSGTGMPVPYMGEARPRSYDELRG